jgi:hypothetical protein
MGIWLGDGSFNTRLNAAVMGKHCGSRRGTRGGVVASPRSLGVSVCPTRSVEVSCVKATQGRGTGFKWR